MIIHRSVQTTIYKSAKTLILPFLEILLFRCARIPVQGSGNTTDPVLRRGSRLHDIRKGKARGGDGDVVAWMEFDSMKKFHHAPQVSIYLFWEGCWISISLSFPILISRTSHGHQSLPRRKFEHHREHQPGGRLCRGG